MPLVLSGDGAVGPLSATEVSYLDGVTSAVQTQLNGKAATPGAWSSYTPTLTNFTVGSGGTVVGKYAVVGTLVCVHVTATLGSSGFSVGDTQVGLPVTTASKSSFSFFAEAVDVGTSLYPLHCTHQDGSTSSVRVLAINASGTYAGITALSSTVPFTWGAGDILYFSGTYEAA